VAEVSAKLLPLPLPPPPQGPAELTLLGLFPLELALASRVFLIYDPLLVICSHLIRLDLLYVLLSMSNSWSILMSF